MTSPNKKRERFKGRRESGRFAMLPESVLMHPAVTTAPPAVRWVLVALTAQYNGHNNGALVLTTQVAKAFGIGSVDTLRRGLGDLEQRQLIEKIDPGSYRPPRPARFAITWKPLDATEWCRQSPAAHAYRRWVRDPEEK
jgi:triphosphoribosyl-dephospho-CoA synthetase